MHREEITPLKPALYRSLLYYLLFLADTADGAIQKWDVWKPGHEPCLVWDIKNPVAATGKPSKNVTDCKKEPSKM
jgi:hypothetical protein